MAPELLDYCMRGGIFSTSFHHSAVLMISQCPKCHVRLTDFAVTCEKCGWSMINTASPPAPTPPVQDLPKKIATIKKSALDESAEAPVVIVKNVAKTAPPPPPQDKATDDVLPPLKEKMERSPSMKSRWASICKCKKRWTTSSRKTTRPL